jgi:hypothetical protein
MPRIFQINGVWYLEKSRSERKSLRTMDKKVAEKALEEALKEKSGRIFKKHLCYIHDLRLENVEGKAWIYFIQAEPGGLVKIGYTENLDKRLRIIQSHSPLKMKIIGKIRGSRATEAEIHSKFNKDRKHGEWFVSSERLMKLIEIHGDNESDIFPEIDITNLPW